jgi:TatA/E family protein of Tat protein translocase
MGSIQGWHIIIIIVLALLLFGAPKLPGMARSVGQSLRIFKSEVKQMKDENNTPDAGPVQGRVVDPAPQTYAPTHQNPVQPDQQQAPRYTTPPQYTQPQHHAGDGQGQSPVNGANQAGPSHQGGTSHSSQ